MWLAKRENRCPVDECSLVRSAKGKHDTILISENEKPSFQPRFSQIGKRAHRQDRNRHIALADS